MIQHVTLELRREDEEAALAFWALLGFERVEPPGPLGEISTWVQRHTMQVHLLFRDDPVVPPAGHTAVVPDDFDATIHALRAAGHEPEERAPHWGAARSFVHAPGGHLVEIMASPPV